MEQIPSTPQDAVPAQLVIARLQARIGEQAGTIALLEARIGILTDRLAHASEEGS